MTKAVFLLLLVPALAFAQGQIIFSNSSETAITNWYNGQIAPTSTRVGFYINPNPNAWSSRFPGWIRIGSTNLVAPGIFLGGVQTLPFSLPVAVQVRAWLSTGSFDSFEEALVNDPEALFGYSIAMRIAPTEAPGSPPTLIGSGLHSFFIYPTFAIVEPTIPEPTTLALAGLGLAFLAFRKLARRLQPRR